MSYRLVISRRAQKSMANLRPPGCVKLKGSEDWRIRVGNYRVVYGVRDEERIVEVLNVGHRRDVYPQG